MSRRYLIVGCGAAAWSAVHAIRAHDAAGRITIVSDEPAPPYARMLLSYWLDGRADEAAMHPFPADHFERLGAQVFYGDRAVTLDPARRTVVLASGRELSYDELLIATGASPIRPPIPGLDRAPVFHLWRKDDVRGILAATRPGGDAVIVGAGFIGMQAVDALARRGMRCTVIELLPHVLPRVLDASAAHLIEAALAEHGVRVLTGTRVVEVRSQAGRRTEVLVAGGRAFPADLVVVAAGIRPNVDLARSGGLSVSTGIVVDEWMRASASHVYAAGDAAEGRDLSTGVRAVHAIWPTAVEQGRVAGLNMTGARVASAGSLNINVLEVVGVPLASVGVFEGRDVEARTDGCGARGAYRKLAFRDGRLVGAVLVRDIRDIGLLQAMIRQQADLAPWKASLPRAPLTLGTALLVAGGRCP